MILQVQFFTTVSMLQNENDLLAFRLHDGSLQDQKTKMSVLHYRLAPTLKPKELAAAQL